ncbi:MAG TPA: RDD family protein [Terriglobales bacterium]|nr:RDD family protein [Terriglobales bacterium]
MSCSICGKICRCAESRQKVTRTVVLDDMEPYQDTEEQFASSVAGTAYRHQELASGKSDRHPIAPQEASQTDLPSSSMNSTENLTPDSWKDELASRLQNYKARRRRSAGDSSLSFNFESTTANHVFLRPERDPEPEPVYQEPDPAPSYMHTSAAPALEEPITAATVADLHEQLDEAIAETQASFAGFAEPVVKATPEPAKLIVFPRPPMMQEPPRDQLADPVFETPRIVEVPEAVQVAIPLADITLQPDVPEDQCVPHIEELAELPYRVAPQAQRIAAEIVDTLTVAVATGIFGTILAKMNAAVLLTDPKTTIEMAFMIPVTFWCLYKYMFLVYSGTTPGMKLAKLQLINFDGELPGAKRRRNRALSMIVSIFPLGMGLLWSFVDPDQLCWHDRISKTYLTGR